MADHARRTEIPGVSAKTCRAGVEPCQLHPFIARRSVRLCWLSEVQ